MSNISEKKAIREKYVIKDVPFVSQENNIFCSYASRTMIFKYYGFDTSLQEVLFYSGIGYSSIYFKQMWTIAGGTILSQSIEDQYFLANLFGLEYEIWQPNREILSEDGCWQEYWNKIKQNITNDIPVKISINPIFLPVYRKIKRSKSASETQKSEKIHNFIPGIIAKYIPGSHAIIIVGFDEIKGIVYYIDPYYKFISSSPEKSKYMSTSIEVFKNAVNKVEFGDNPPKYLIETYKRIQNPLSKDEAFKKAYSRNVEKMAGKKNAYDKKWKNSILGISAAEELKRIYKKNNIVNGEIIPLYKRKGIKLYLIKNLIKIFKKISKREDIIILGPFKQIITEKQNAFNYLKKTNLSHKYEKDVKLLKYEIDKWMILASYASKFIKKNIFLTKRESANIIDDMREILDEIIEIEKKIIHESVDIG